MTISKEIEKVTKEINEKYDQQESTIYVSSADLVETSVQTMIKEVLLGALFATIVIMIFLRNIRTTFITIVSIPLSLCFTLVLVILVWGNIKYFNAWRSCSCCWSLGG